MASDKDIVDALDFMERLMARAASRMPNAQVEDAISQLRSVTDKYMRARALKRQEMRKAKAKWKTD